MIVKGAFINLLQPGLRKEVNKMAFGPNPIIRKMEQIGRVMREAGVGQVMSSYPDDNWIVKYNDGAILVIPAHVAENSTVVDLAAKIIKRSLSASKISRPNGHHIGRVHVSLEAGMWYCVYQTTSGIQLVTSAHQWRDALRKMRAKVPRKRKMLGGLMGLRYWPIALTSEGPILYPVTRDPSAAGDPRLNPWFGPVVHADHKPERENRNGLYCFALTPDGLIRAEQELSGLRNTKMPWARGLLMIWGRVIKGQWGYRAEHAVVRRLELLQPTWAPVVEALEQRYKCDVITWKGTTDEHR